MPQARSAKKKPNIVFILADDLGWSDVSYNGSRFFQTPNIDQFSKQGITFTNAYSPAPLCTASRAAILTGKNPARLRVTAASVLPYPTPDGRFPPADRVGDPSQKLLQPTPYWYLKEEELTIAELLQDAGYATACIGKWHVGEGPTGAANQGFETTFGANWQPGPPSYFYPYHIETITTGVPGEYLTDRLTDEAAAFLENNKDNPFFLLLSHYAPHTPIQAKPEDVEHFKARIEPDDCQNNATYAGMIKSLDESVGDVLAKLDELGLSDDTIVIFMSDNGGATYKDQHEQTITCNRPLRAGKATLYEGGIRVPAVVRWKGVTTPGTQCDTTMTGADLFPTLLASAGVAIPKGIPQDSADITPLLKGRKMPSRPLFFHFPHYIPLTDTTPCSAVRDGDYKLIKFYEGYTELYNLAEDVSEMNNLAGQLPQTAAKLEKKLDDFIESVQAQLPIPNPAYNPNL